MLALSDPARHYSLATGVGGCLVKPAAAQLISSSSCAPACVLEWERRRVVLHTARARRARDARRCRMQACTVQLTLTSRTITWRCCSRTRAKLAETEPPRSAVDKSAAPLKVHITNHHRPPERVERRRGRRTASPRSPGRWRTVLIDAVVITVTLTRHGHRLTEPEAAASRARPSAGRARVRDALSLSRARSRAA